MASRGDDGTASDWLPGIRDEHDDEGGWQARWLDRPDVGSDRHAEHPQRTGQRPARRRPAPGADPSHRERSRGRRLGGVTRVVDGAHRVR